MLQPAGRRTLYVWSFLGWCQLFEQQRSGYRGLLQHIGLDVIIGLVFGFVMSLTTNAFVEGVRALMAFRHSHQIGLVSFGGFDLSLSPLIGLLVAALLVIGVRKLFGITRWHGPADSIFAAHRTDNELDVKAGFGSTLAAFISASGGASVGQYGPLVHFGATVGSALRSLKFSPLQTDVFIGCGVAGAIAAGFNAPIAGVVFAHEAILRHFSLRAIVPIVIASTSSVWFSHRLFSPETLFAAPSSSIAIDQIMPYALIVGPLFGLVAVLFMLAIRMSARFTAKSPLSPTQLILLAGLLTGLVGIFVPDVLGLGTKQVAEMIDGKHQIGFLILLLLLKIACTALCIGWGLFGGVFSPAIFVGAASGAAIGRIIAGFGVAGAGPVIAICGMASVAASVIGAPITGVLIILEMTMNYEYALLAMMSIVTSVLISNLIFGHSFFDRQLLDRGIDVSLGRGHIEMMETPVADIVTYEYCKLGEGMSAASAISEITKLKVTEAYIIADDRTFRGKITLHDLLTSGPDDPIVTLVDASPISIKHDASLQQAIEIASKFVGESIPVINRETGHMLGVVSEADLLQLYLSLQTRIADLERT